MPNPIDKSEKFPVPPESLAAWERINAMRAEEGKEPLPPLEPASYDDDDDLDPLEVEMSAPGRPQPDPPEPTPEEAPDWWPKVRRLKSWSDEERTAETDCPPWPEQREEALSVLDAVALEDAREAGGLRPFVSKVPPYAKPQPRLPAGETPDFALPPAPPLPTEETEALLNGVIADCRLFMREIAFHSARLAVLETDRTSFIHAACRMAETAGGVGKSVARLRASHGGAPMERKKVVFEYSHTAPALEAPAGREGGSPR